MRRTPRSLIVLAAVACLCSLPFFAADPAGGKVAEKSTGVEFETSRAVPGAANPLDLTGTGVRTKLVFKVYAFGLYVDRDAARKELAGWAGKDAETLQKDAAFYAAVASLKGDRAAVLHFVREVSADKMKEAMTEAMDRGVPAGDPARAAFLALWTKPILSGEDVVLHFGPDGQVSLIRDAKVVGTVTSAALSRSLLQSWLGPNPVSESIRAGIAVRFPQLLAR